MRATHPVRGLGTPLRAYPPAATRPRCTQTFTAPATARGVKRRARTRRSMRARHVLDPLNEAGRGALAAVLLHERDDALELRALEVDERLDEVAVDEAARRRLLALVRERAPLVVRQVADRGRDARERLLETSEEGVLVGRDGEDAADRAVDRAEQQPRRVVRGGGRARRRRRRAAGVCMCGNVGYGMPPSFFLDPEPSRDDRDPAFCPFVDPPSSRSRESSLHESQCHRQ